MTDKNTHPQLEHITSEAEAGRGQALSDAVSNLGYEDRIVLIKQMDDLNKARRQADSSLPDLVITMGQESRVLDYVPYFGNVGHHNVYLGVRCSSPFFSNVSSGGIYYESFDPLSLERTTYTKESSHWTWNQRSIKR